MTLYKSLLNWALPNTCIACKQNLIPPAKLCLTCRDDFKTISFNHSANLLHRADIGRLFNKPSFDSVFALCWYEDYSAMWLKQVKYHGAQHVCIALQQLLKKQLRLARQYNNWVEPELCLPVPLHWFRYLRRGYNQSELIWQNLHLPLNPKVLKRTRYTQPQTNLLKSQRQNNLKHAFSCSLNKTFKHVAILDDTLTTGSTVNEIAKLLKYNGVEYISVWAVAIAPKK